ncbi:ROK family protein [Paenibacillus sp. CAU 1782]
MDIQKGMGHVVGIDVGGTKTMVCIASADGGIKLLEKWETSQHGKPELFFEWLFGELRSLLARTELTLEDISGIGIGFPGVISEGGKLSHAPALPWPEGDILPYIRQYYQGYVKLGNDVNMALLGECWQGSAQGKRHVLLLTVGTGIGGAMLLNGRLYEGAGGAAGEAGYAIVDLPALNGQPLSGDAFGPLESVTSGTGIGDHAKAYFEGKSVSGSDSIGAPQVLQGAIAGDPDYLAIMEKPLQHMAAFIGSATSLLNPELVLLGGGVADSGDYYVKEIVERVPAFTPFRVDIRKAGLGNKAGAIGAAAAAARIFE